MSDEPEDELSHTPHLRPMEQSLVDRLCDQAEAVSLDSFSVRLEIEGFRLTGTPWDARRLANALAWVWGRKDERTPLVIAELDKLVLEKAGLKPGMRPGDKVEE